MNTTMTLRGEAPGAGRIERPDPGTQILAEGRDDPLTRERARLAYAIHDGLTQVVTASVLELESLAQRVRVEPSEATGAIEGAIHELRNALDEIRDMLATLTPAEPSRAQPIEDLLRSVLERWRLPATWSVEGDLDRVTGAVLEAASSVIREGVANAAKHAGPGEVDIRVLASNGSVEVSVQDRGKGFTSSSAVPSGHLGLEMLRRRVADVNGTLDVQSAPGKGTRVVARLPVLGETT